MVGILHCKVGSGRTDPRGMGTTVATAEEQEKQRKGNDSRERRSVRHIAIIADASAAGNGLTMQRPRHVDSPMRFRFLTSTPLDFVRGSGTFAGIATLAKFLKKRGAEIELVKPAIKFPIYTIERLIFNQRLRLRTADSDAITVGFDMDGYAVAGAWRSFHVASIKGVVADEMRFERGLTRATMRLQARCEKIHVQRADLVIAPSNYSAQRMQELYGINHEPVVIPEGIDLSEWQHSLRRNPKPPAKNGFVVLTVCRFYPRKRLHILLGAANRLRSRIPGMEVRLVGDGPEASRLRSIWQSLKLEGIVRWLGDLTSDELAREYNYCDVFCLPSVQESFGIVFLEAMASNKPIVAARSASVPEVVEHGVLVEPENEEALADAIQRLYDDPALRQSLADEGLRRVCSFDAPRVVESFLREVELASGLRSPARLPAVG